MGELPDFRLKLSDDKPPFDSFDAALNTKVFLQYCEQMFNAENLSFYWTVECYKSASLLKKTFIFKSIMNEYIVEGSARQINVAYSTRIELEKAMDDTNVNVDTVLNRAQQEIYELMHTDVWYNFYNSALYARHAEDATIGAKAKKTVSPPKASKPKKKKNSFIKMSSSNNSSGSGGGGTGSNNNSGRGKSSNKLWASLFGSSRHAVEQEKRAKHLRRQSIKVVGDLLQQRSGAARPVDKRLSMAYYYDDDGQLVESVHRAPLRRATAATVSAKSSVTVDAELVLGDDDDDDNDIVDNNSASTLPRCRSTRSRGLYKALSQSPTRVKRSVDTRKLSDGRPPRRAAPRPTSPPASTAADTNPLVAHAPRARPRSKSLTSVDAPHAPARRPPTPRSRRRRPSSRPDSTSPRPTPSLNSSASSVPRVPPRDPSKDARLPTSRKSQRKQRALARAISTSPDRSTPPFKPVSPDDRPAALQNRKLQKFFGVELEPKKPNK
mmetsp:Transcript_5067/g.8201  ORF Transcript_5067/g.8201 Transcript_5067/m.8201 type:complete len:495 (-) Transcript_5067:20-1504(-)